MAIKHFHNKRTPGRKWLWITSIKGRAKVGLLFVGNHMWMRTERGL